MQNEGPEVTVALHCFILPQSAYFTLQRVWGAPGISQWVASCFVYSCIHVWPITMQNKGPKVTMTLHCFVLPQSACFTLQRVWGAHGITQWATAIFFCSHTHLRPITMQNEGPEVMIALHCFILPQSACFILQRVWGAPDWRMVQHKMVQLFGITFHVFTDSFSINDQNYYYYAVRMLWADKGLNPEPVRKPEKTSLLSVY